MFAWRNVRSGVAAGRGALAAAIAVTALGGCAGSDAASGDERLVQVVGYATPARQARGGVLTYHPWDERSFPVGVSGSTAVVSVEGLVVTCPPPLVCRQVQGASASVRAVYARTPRGLKADLLVSKPGYESVAAPVVFDDQSHTYLVILRPSAPGTP